MTAATVLRRLTGRNQPTDRYVGRHRADTIQPVTADWSPLHPADRQALAPHHYADRHLPAGPDERTGHLDPEQVRAASTQGGPAQACGSRVDVLAEMRADLAGPAAALVADALTDNTPEEK
ncbi:hypothetical protein E0H26_11585 [Micromonospora zingiberis]|uniref:Uncharacterized protein n=1 Tax=Micromonospora zingiberis TaxID=2053011 RepID=A0A4R0GM82_9ACTN|nr:hypothetical protein [Micromonospora zingiberis]TCB97553.1 hypothetical protein E0H26_11585 [Micromonospora zingiberis]